MVLSEQGGESISDKTSYREIQPNIKTARSRPRLNIRTTFPRMDSYYKENTVVRPSYIYNGNHILLRRRLYIETVPCLPNVYIVLKSERRLFNIKNILGVRIPIMKMIHCLYYGNSHVQDGIFILKRWLSVPPYRFQSDYENRKHESCAFASLDRVIRRLVG